MPLHRHGDHATDNREARSLNQESGRMAREPDTDNSGQDTVPAGARSALSQATVHFRQAVDTPEAVRRKKPGKVVSISSGPE